MARIRSVKPELPSDKKMAGIPIAARYTFVLLITQADDEGFIRGEKRQLLGTLYPHDESVTQAQLEAWLEALIGVGAIQFRHTVDGARVVQLTNWQRHQRIQNPSPSKIRESLTTENGDITESFRSPSALEVGSRKKEVGEGEGYIGAGADPADFAACWAAYPKRAGGNSRALALKAWTARRAAGASGADLLAGTQRYAAFVRATGKEGTEYVKQAATFYGPGEHYLEPWDAPSVSVVPSETERDRQRRRVLEIAAMERLSAVQGVAS